MNKIGFHYYPDTTHYAQTDLDLWLPKLTALQARWIVLNADPNRAVPEAFIKRLVAAHIQPILHFTMQPHQATSIQDFQLLFQVYARWGVRHITLFDAPNLRRNWHNTHWLNVDLVEQFLDIYLPLAESSLQFGIQPVFPPLHPGGDYWDTAFLRAALRSIQRRGHTHFLEKFVLGAYASIDEKSLNWGIGGPERWPGVRPYFTPEGAEDQRGFRIFEWYSAITKAILVKPRPIFLFGIGKKLNDPDPTQFDPQKFASVAQLLKGELPNGQTAPLPDEVLGGAFWLSDLAKDEHFARMEAFKPIEKKTVQKIETGAKKRFPIQHYVLLPAYDGVISEVHLQLLRPLLQDQRPTVGFSLTEAALAQNVTVFGSQHDFSETDLNQLRANGCKVARFENNGTKIAPAMYW